MTVEQILEAIKDIPSNVADQDTVMHVKYLSDLPIRQTQGEPGNPLILDFGTGWGKLIISIALACPQAEIYTFDPGIPYTPGGGDVYIYADKVRQILNNHLGKDLHFHINDSYKHEWDRELDVLSIDASHTYEDTKHEIEKYWSFVKSGGLILMHDYIVERVGVKQAVDEYMAEHPEYQILESAGYTTVIKKL